MAPGSTPPCPRIDGDNPAASPRARLAFRNRQVRGRPHRLPSGRRGPNPALGACPGAAGLGRFGLGARAVAGQDPLVAPDGAGIDDNPAVSPGARFAVRDRQVRCRPRRLPSGRRGPGPALGAYSGAAWLDQFGHEARVVAGLHVHHQPMAAIFRRQYQKRPGDLHGSAHVEHHPRRAGLEQSVAQALDQADVLGQRPGRQPPAEFRQIDDQTIGFDQREVGELDRSGQIHDEPGPITTDAHPEISGHDDVPSPGVIGQQRTERRRDNQRPYCTRERQTHGAKPLRD